MDPHAYRASLQLCPGCGDPLAPASLPQATVARCGGCGGVWFDWFDGEVTLLARELNPPAAPAGPLPQRGPCPACSVPLHDEAFQGLGPSVLRCPACLGVFAPAPSLLALAALARDEADLEPSCWLRVLASLRGLLPRGPTR